VKSPASVGLFAFVKVNPVGTFKPDQ